MGPDGYDGLKLTGDNYTIFVSQDDDDAVVDVFMETK